MNITYFRKRSFLSLVISIVFLVLLAGCSVNVKKSENGEDKNVDIKTPVGGIHVSNDADAHDTGLPVYPGARLKPDDKDGDHKNANVNLSGFGFGIKVVAVEYDSDDSEEKVIAFYTKQLKKYGNVLECHHSGHSDHHYDYDSHSSHELKCESDNGKNVELKAGSEGNQHIVSIEPHGSGASFAVVYVRTSGKDDSI